MDYIDAKTLVTRTKNNFWFGTDYNMNIYRGCHQGCIYCDSRSDCYRTENFGKVRAKKNALEIIRNGLSRKVKKGVIGTGAMSDPYNMFEKEHELTRHSLELMSAFGFGVAIVTKSDLILRDIDVLQELAETSPVLAKITITTVDDGIAKKIEPGAPSSSARFQTIRGLSDAGIYAGIVLMPVLPWINDKPADIKELIHKAADSGAKFIYPYFGVTMRAGNREYFYDALDKKFPGLREKYERQFDFRYQCNVPNSRRLYEMCAEECYKLGMITDMKEIIRGYKMGYEPEQLSFFS